MKNISRCNLLFSAILLACCLFSAPAARAASLLSREAAAEAKTSQETPAEEVSADFRVYLLEGEYSYVAFRLPEASGNVSQVSVIKGDVPPGLSFCR